MNFFMFPGLPVEPGCEVMRREVEAKPQLWKFDTRRQDQIEVQRESQAIHLRIGIPENNVHINYWQEAKHHPLHMYFPACMAFLEAFTGHFGGEMGRAAIVKLPLGNKVYPHIDQGTYYSKRDRFHLILSGEYRYVVEDEERIFKEGQLWWFDNQKMHHSETIGEKDRVAIIFDVKNSKWREVYSSFFS